ncbi:neuroglian-like [Planococcus citri]|uniref:neuroglian-like n=1 Tax=Planococcus citri TaxID=170843 RepID=UPI0031F8997A
MTKGFALLFYLLVMVNSNLGQDGKTNGEKKLTPPVLEYGPEDEVYTYYEDTTISLPCLAKGQDTSNENTVWGSWWTKNGVNITSGISLEYSPTDHKFGLNIASAKKKNAGRYQCFVSNGVGVMMSNSTDVRFIEIPKKITETQTLYAIEGQPFNLTCELPQDLVDDENNYWVRKPIHSTVNRPQETFKEPQIIQIPDGSLWFSRISQIHDSENNSELLGKYYYFIPGRKKEICETVLKVQKSSDKDVPDTDPVKRFVTQRNLTAEKGARVKLFCVYGGNPLPVILWEKDGEELKSKDNTLVEESGSAVKIFSFRPEDAGNYTCKVHKNNGTHFETNEFSVKIGKPYFIETPREQTTYVNGSAKFSCTAADGDLNFGLNLTWIFNGMPMSEWPFNADSLIDSEYGKSTLRINNVTDIHVGNYGCNASNTYGYVYKEAYLFTKPAEKVTINDESKANQTFPAQLNEPFNWTCPVEGVPSPNITFMKGDEVIISGDDYTISDDGKTLTIRNFSSNDYGKYVCKATNEITPEPVCAEINVIISKDEPDSKPESESNWLPLILVLLALLLAAIAIGGWCIYDKNYRVDGKYEVKKREKAAAQNGITDETNEALMPAPNAATLNRVRKTNESTRDGSGNSRNGCVTVEMEPTH